MPGLQKVHWEGDPAAVTRSARRSGHVEAYVPDLLTGMDLSLPASVSADIGDAEQAIRSINEPGAGFDNADPLARFLLRAEAVASSNMEGLEVSVRRLARTEEVTREGRQATDATAVEVLGNVRAMEMAVSLLSDPARAVTVDDLRAVHCRLLENTPHAAWGGIIRDEQNWIGGQSPFDALYVPPPPELVPRLMDDLVAYMSSDEHPAVLQAALTHIQFETIHPFADGNGRTGRALIHAVLRRRGLAPRVLPPVSLILATWKPRYIDALSEYQHSASGGYSAMARWIELFNEAVGRSCADVKEFSEHMSSWEAASREALHSPQGRLPRANSAIDKLLRAMPALPVFSVDTAAAYLNQERDSVEQAVARMLNAGVIKQSSLGRRNRTFEAIGLLDQFTRLERQLASVSADTETDPPSRRVPQRPARPAASR